MAAGQKPPHGHIGSNISNPISNQAGATPDLCCPKERKDRRGWRQGGRNTGVTTYELSAQQLRRDRSPDRKRRPANSPPIHHPSAITRRTSPCVNQAAGGSRASASIAFGL